MFIGHFAPALVAATRKAAPSLPALFFAAQLVDWVLFALLIVGVEKMRMVPGVSAMNPMDLYHMPYSHSLLGSIAWATAFGLLILWATRRRTAALLGFAVVLSHWFLDLLVHVPDLTLAGAPPKLGLGLWNHPAIEMPLELALTFGAMWFYTRRRPGPALPVVVMAVLLLVMQSINWFGPVEPHVTVATSVLAFAAYGVATAAAWWVGRTRSA